jgi:hypothetical protein
VTALHLRFVTVSKPASYLAMFLLPMLIFKDTGILNMDYILLVNRFLFFVHILWGFYCTFDSVRFFLFLLMLFLNLVCHLYIILCVILLFLFLGCNCVAVVKYINK